MVGGHGSRRLSGQLIELAGGDAGVDSGADLLRYADRIAVLLAETVAQFLQARSDLIEVDGLLAPVPLDDVHLRLPISEALLRNSSEHFATAGERSSGTNEIIGREGRRNRLGNAG